MYTSDNGTVPTMDGEPIYLVIWDALHDDSPALVPFQKPHEEAPIVLVDGLSAPLSGVHPAMMPRFWYSRPKRLGLLAEISVFYSEPLRPRALIATKSNGCNVSDKPAKRPQACELTSSKSPISEISLE